MNHADGLDLMAVVGVQLRLHQTGVGQMSVIPQSHHSLLNDDRQTVLKHLKRLTVHF
jgi:hypothetical protein